MAIQNVGAYNYSAGWTPAIPAGPGGQPASYAMPADQYVNARPVVAAGGPSDGGVLKALSGAISRLLEKLLNFFRGGSAQAQAA
ncbi:MAG: hypothetical protein FJZ01_25130, partial [Candidatus Sericytochromatia bacterium]|nr:hypothetical protein [Candidatus Tanganyikabacteria bacterium]